MLKEKAGAVVNVGAASFEKIISQKGFYIDKTKLIADILSTGSEAYLFIRPRRFGKSINMTMLKAFFSIDQVEKNRQLFAGTYIEHSPYWEHQGQYPVIYLDLKELQAKSFADFKMQFFYKIAGLCTYFEWMLKSDKLSDAYKHVLSQLIYEPENEKLFVKYQNSLSFLCRCFSQIYDRRAVILIDEYDKPFIDAFSHGYMEDAVNFLEPFFSSALKGNEQLQFGVLTGTLRLAQIGVFSELNNFDLYSVLKTKFDEAFGFTDAEVMQALAEHGLSAAADDVRAFYDGYLFGKEKIFNPWSVSCYLAKRELGPYWVETSSNDFLVEAVKRSSRQEAAMMLKLAYGGIIHAEIASSVKLSSSPADLNIWELFLYAGYLTLAQPHDSSALSDVYALKIPNKEVSCVFRNLFLAGCLNFSSTDTTSLLNALGSCDPANLKMRISSLVLRASSYYDRLSENSYHMLVSGFLFACDSRYIVISQPESGSGRPDLILEPRTADDYGYVFEFKTAADEADIAQMLQTALEQIKNKRYDDYLRRRGYKKICIAALVFSHEKVEMLAQELTAGSYETIS